jgi:hypothetical protein
VVPVTLTFFGIGGIYMKLVMPGLVPGIHVFLCTTTSKAWMAGTSPAMTDE